MKNWQAAVRSLVEKMPTSADGYRWGTRDRTEDSVVITTPFVYRNGDIWEFVAYEMGGSFYFCDDNDCVSEIEMRGCSADPAVLETMVGEAGGFTKKDSHGEILIRMGWSMDDFPEKAQAFYELLNAVDIRFCGERKELPPMEPFRRAF